MAIARNPLVVAPRTDSGGGLTNQLGAMTRSYDNRVGSGRGIGNARGIRRGAMRAMKRSMSRRSSR